MDLFGKYNYNCKYMKRLLIALAITAADFFGAASFGLDVFMNGSTRDDDEVLVALSSSEHLVLPSSFTERVPNSLLLLLSERESH